MVDQYLPLITCISSTLDPVLMSLKPGTRVANPYPETPAEKGLVRQLSSLRFQAVGAVTRRDLDFMEEVEHCMVT